MLQASIENSAQIDSAFEAMFNLIFCVIVVVIIMSQLGFDPVALFLSLSSVVLGFAFVIGSAASKYFEGILFILLRRPYNIGMVNLVFLYMHELGVDMISQFSYNRGCNSCY